MSVMADDQKHENASSKREYKPPKLERLGTIRDLTHGSGKDGDRDQVHPPGLNKSVL
jgi:hypothetical protein